MTYAAQLPRTRDNTGRKKPGKTPKVMSQAKLFDVMGYHPHAVQREIHTHEATNRFILACAGRRTGKSTLGGHRLTVEAFKALYRTDLSKTGKRAEFWIVGLEYIDAEKEFRVMYNDMSKIGLPFDKPGTYNDALGGNMHVSLWGGKFQVHAKSAKYPDSLVGEALHGVILAEAAKLKPAIWTKYIRPMLADYRGWGLFTSTPEGKNWFYDQYMRGQDPNDPNWWSIRMPSWSNDIVFPKGRYDDEILDMAKDMSDEKFKQEIGAEFTEFVGRVFKRFNEDDHVGDYEYNPNLPLYIAEDSGFTNPSVALFLQVDVWDNVTIIGEYYQTHRTPEEFAKDVSEHPRLGPMSRIATLLYADPADPGTAATLAQKWNVKQQSGTGGLLSDRIDLIRRWLKPQPEELADGHPEKVPRLHMDRSCVNLIREMNDYRYPENKTDALNDREQPLKKDDHAPEALGRFFAGKYGKILKAKRSARQSTARNSRT
jgi:hypothetical protein